MNRKIVLFLLFIFIPIFSYGDGPYGNRKWKKKGIHNGNLVRTLFYNQGEVAQWPHQPSGEWPKGTGNSYVDGVTPLVGAEVVDIHGKTIHVVEAGYREMMQISPDGVEYGWQPLPGYCNFDQDSPAMSDNPNSWPKCWPGLDHSWCGKWNGYFGQKTNADQESFFVFDDAQDHRFDFYPQANDSIRGGIGLKVDVRGFQWAHVLAEDVIFWHYDICNIGDNDLKKVYFGMYMDNGVGGPDDSLDDGAFYDTKVDITYAWDCDFQGQPGWVDIPGYVGYAFLESPGNPWDGIDNDEDGIVDERRDDDIDNDDDWTPFSDLNGNGIWDQGEPLNDDVGKDGLSPLDTNYLGPDEGEGDGVPTDGEPNFDKTDKDESDQIGLTSVDLIVAGLSGDITFEAVGCEDLWRRMSAGHFEVTPKENVNSGIIYASGSFPLKADLRERFSMALLFGKDLDDLIRNKNTVQLIYNNNYNFARPPNKPTVKYVAGDHRVTLYWDTFAEQSVDPFLRDSTGAHRKDFEGYTIYRATDPSFMEARQITDSYGNLIFRKPIAQFDLIDGITGPHPVGVHGAHFNMGTDSGLLHSWTDTTVQNGQTYYYAVVSYDQGDTLTGLAPSECNSIIEVNVAGNVRTDINTIVVTPNAPAAGYRPPEIKNSIEHVVGPGTGYVRTEFNNPTEIKENNEYRITFTDTSFLRQTEYYNVYDMSTDPPTLIVENCEAIGYDEMNRPLEGPLFDGIRLFMYNDTIAIKPELSGWQTGTKCNYLLKFGPSKEGLPKNSIPYPADYEIRFYDHIVDTSAGYNFWSVPVNFEIWNITDSLKVDFLFYDFDKDSTLSNDDKIIPLYYLEGDSVVNIGDRRSHRMAWEVRFITSEDSLGVPPVAPQEGDVLLIHTTKPFRAGDILEFETRGAQIDIALAKRQMDRIAVVPDPYVVTASWEPANRYRSGRGERKIDFIHLPAKCTIRIYTISGNLVDMIEHDKPIDDGSESWNLVSKDGMNIAYGIYIYHVDAPGVGEKIGKFSVIK